MFIARMPKSQVSEVPMVVVLIVNQTTLLMPGACVATSRTNLPRTSGACSSIRATAVNGGAGGAPQKPTPGGLEGGGGGQSAVAVRGGAGGAL